MKVKTHPYVRAYLAGIAVPTALQLLILTALATAHYLWELPMSVDRLAVFPLALVPSAWGAWNIVHVAMFERRRLHLGLHGATLALILLSLGWGVAKALGHPLPGLSGGILVVGLASVILLYYLLWKHLVGFLNDMLGISG